MNKKSFACKWTRKNSSKKKTIASYMKTNLVECQNNHLSGIKNMIKTISRSQESRIQTLTKRQEFKTTNLSTKLSVSLRNFYSRAIARSRGLIAGDPGGVSACKFVSSTLPVCMTVILCLKSNGKEIWPGAFFKSCRGKKTRH